MVVGVLSFLSIAFLALAVAGRMTSGSRLLQKILPATHEGSVRAVLEETAGDTVLARLAQPILRVLERLTGPVGRRKGVDVLRQRLSLAGNPAGLHAEEFWAVRLAASGVAAVAAGSYATVGGSEGLLEAVVAGFVVYRLFDLWLSAQITRRQKEVQRDLLTWLDQIATVSEAGASLPESIRRVSEGMPGLLGREAYRAWSESHAGGDLATALERMAERLGVEDLLHIVSVIRQQMALGTGVSQIFRTQAHYLRTQRRLRIEELTQKATPKLLLPTILVVAACLDLVLYPALSSIHALFGH